MRACKTLKKIMRGTNLDVRIKFKMNKNLIFGLVIFNEIYSERESRTHF